MKGSKLAAIVLTIAVLFSITIDPVFAGSTAYATDKISGVSTSYVTIDLNDKSIKPVVMIAGNNMCSAQSVAGMAKAYNAVAAINGTYFSAYDGVPVPYGTLIKDGKLLHSLNSGAVAGFTADGKFMVDRLQIEFEGYINGEYRAIPWRINHPSSEADAITIFTPEYGVAVTVAPGAKAAVVQNGSVTQIAEQNFTVPTNGFAILYNPEVSHYVDERYKIGDAVSYKAIFKTQFTDAADWDQVVCAVGAGPSLIINGQITADGAAEGFTEAKINTNASGRSFIGATAEGKVVIGTMKSATLSQAAKACQNMGLVNAMCLDGGGSVGLYYNGSSKTAGRNVNNALGFIQQSGAASTAATGITAVPAKDKIMLNGQALSLDAYKIGGSNYFKLRDLAYSLNGTEKQFEVQFDAAKNAIKMLGGQAYTAAGSGVSQNDGQNKTAQPTKAKVYFNDQELKLTAYSIDGNTYFKLRDIMNAVDVTVGYDDTKKTITLQTKADGQ